MPKKVAAAVIILEEDVRASIGSDELRRMIRGGAGGMASGDALASALVAVLPRVAAMKFGKACPDGFQVDRVVIKGQLRGSLFGVGLDGEVSVEVARI